MKVKQTDPRAGYLAHKKEVDAAIQRVLESGNYILGPEVEVFEQEFAEWLGAEHAVGVANGTDAVMLALVACGVKPGDEVITVSHTALPTVTAIERAGAIPVFVDIDESTFCMNAELIEPAITERTKAVVPVHLYGHPCDMPAIMAIARKHGLKVIEDCAQAHGAGIWEETQEDISRRGAENAEREKQEPQMDTNEQECLNHRDHGARSENTISSCSLDRHSAKGATPGSYLTRDSGMQAHGAIFRKVGTYGDAAAFSFYPTKNLGCFGDGGCVVTGNKETAERLKMLRQYGWNADRESVMSGWNSRLDEMQAAILRVGLKHLDADNDSRVAAARRYTEGLADRKLTLPSSSDSVRHVYHQYVVRHHNRDLLRAELLNKGIGTAVHYPIPVHMQDAYKKYTPEGGLQVTEKICKEILSLPMHPQLTCNDVDIVISELLTMKI